MLAFRQKLPSYSQRTELLAALAKGQVRQRGRAGALPAKPATRESRSAGLRTSIDLCPLS